MSIQDKQQLLLSEIIQKGYDPDLFESSVNHHRQLDDWHYDELKQAIKTFQDQQSDYYQILQCATTKPSQLGQATSIQVVGFDKTTKGIFQSIQVNFIVNTSPFNWTVRRRYEDFIALRDVLVRVAHMPEVPVVRKSPVEFTYIKQKHYLQMFIDYIVADKELLNLPIVEDFLKLENPPPFQPIALTSLSGDYGIRINQSMEDQIRKTEQYIHTTYPTQKKAYKLLKTFMKGLKNNCATMQQISEVYSKLYTDTKHQDNTLKDAYLIVSHLFEQWGRIQQDHVKILNQTLYTQQRFQSCLIAPLKDAIKVRDTQQANILDFSRKLQAKKERLYQVGDVLRWDLDESYLDQYRLDQIKSTKKIAFQAMCKQDNAQQSLLRNNFGRTNLLVYESLEHSIKYAASSLKEFGQRMANEIAQSLQQYHVLWADTTQDNFYSPTQFGRFTFSSPQSRFNQRGSQNMTESYSTRNRESDRDMNSSLKFMQLRENQQAIRQSVADLKQNLVQGRLSSDQGSLSRDNVTLTKLLQRIDSKYQKKKTEFSELQKQYSLSTISRLQLVGEPSFELDLLNELQHVSNNAKKLLQQRNSEKLRQGVVRDVQEMIQQLKSYHGIVLQVCQAAQVQPAQLNNNILLQLLHRNSPNLQQLTQLIEKHNHIHPESFEQIYQIIQSTFQSRDQDAAQIAELKQQLSKHEDKHRQNKNLFTALQSQETAMKNLKDQNLQMTNQIAQLNSIISNQQHLEQEVTHLKEEVIQKNQILHQYAQMDVKSNRQSVQDKKLLQMEADLTSLQDLLFQKHQEIEQQNVQNIELVEQLQEAELAVKQLETSKKQMEHELFQVRAKIQNERIENQKDKVRADTLMLNYQKLFAEFKTKENEQEEFKILTQSKIKQLTMEVSELNQRILKGSTQLQQSQSTIRKYEKDEEFLQTQLESLKFSNQNLQQEIDKLTQDLEDNSDESHILQELKCREKEMTKQHQLIIDQYEQDVAQNQEVIKHLQEQIESITQNYQAALQKERDAVYTCKQRVNEVEHEENKNQQQILTLKQKVSILELTVEQQKKDILQRQENQQQLQLLLKSNENHSKQFVTESQQQITELHQQLQKYHLEDTQTSGQVQALQNANNEITKQQQIITDLNNQLHQQNELIEQLNNTIHTLQQQRNNNMEDLQLQLQQLQTTTVLSKQVQESEHQITLSQQEIIIQQQQQSITKLQMTIEEMQAQAQSHQITNEDLKQQLQVFQSKVNHLTDQVLGYKQQLSDENHRISELEQIQSQNEQLIEQLNQQHIQQQNAKLVEQSKDSQIQHLQEQLKQLQIDKDNIEISHQHTIKQQQQQHGEQQQQQQILNDAVQQIQQQQLQIQQSEYEILSLQSQLASLKEEQNMLMNYQMLQSGLVIDQDVESQQQQDYQQELKQYQTQIDELALSNNLLTTQNQELMNQIKDQTVEIQSLISNTDQDKGKIEKLITQVNSLEQQYQLTNANVEQLSAQNKQLTNQIVQLTNENTSLSKEQETITNLNGKLTIQVEQLSAQCDSETVLTNQLKQQIDQLTIQHNQYSESLSAQKQQKDEQICQLTQQNQQLREQVESLTTQNQQYQIQLDSLTSSNPQLIEKISQQKTQLELLQSQVHQQDKQIVQLNSQNKQLTEQNNSLAEQNHLITEQIQSQQAQMQSTTQQNQQLTEQVEQLNLKNKEQIDKLELQATQNQQLIEQIATKSQEIEQQTSENQQLTTQLKSLTSQNQEQTQLVQSLKQQNQDCKQSIDSLSLSNSQLMEKLELLNNQVESLTQQNQQQNVLIESLTSSNPQLVEKIELLSKEVQSLTQQNQQQTGLVESLNTQIEQLKEQIELLKSQNQQYKEQIESLTQQNQQQTIQIEQLTNQDHQYKQQLEQVALSRSELNSKIDQLMKEIKQQASQNQQQTEQLRQQIDQLTTQNNQFTDKIQQQVNELVIAEITLKQKNEQIAQLENNVSNLKREQEEALKLFAKKDYEILQLQIEIESKQVSSDRSRIMIEEQQGELQKQFIKLQTEMQTIRGLFNPTGSLEECIRNHLKNTSALQQTIDDTNMQLLYSKCLQSLVDDYLRNASALFYIQNINNVESSLQGELQQYLKEFQTLKCKINGRTVLSNIKEVEEDIHLSQDGVAVNDDSFIDGLSIILNPLVKDDSKQLQVSQTQEIMILKQKISDSVEENNKLITKLQQLVERLSHKENEIAKLNELAREYKHKLMGLQKTSIDPQAVHTKAHLKECFKKFLIVCGPKVQDYGLGDVILNTLFQFLDISERDREELLDEMAPKGADKRKGIVGVLFKK